MKRIFLLLMAMVCCLGSGFAAIVKGRVVDEQSSPLDYVNVAIRLDADKSRGFGAVTDENGYFVIKDITLSGQYTMEISFVGYKTVTKPVNIKTVTSEVKVGTIALQEDTKMLGDVEVVGQASQMRFDIDKKVFNVDANISAAGASATDILENIPSVDVDQDGEVSLRNSSSVEIWINGKPSGLTEENRAQVLQQMPAGSIQSIEIITNPSAKYNPEGTAGIINIIMKKDRKMGYYGSVSAAGSITTSRKPGTQESFNFNLNSKVVDFYINAGFNWNKMQHDNYTDRYSFRPGTDPIRSDTLGFLNTFVDGNNKGYGIYGRSGLDFHLTDIHTLSVYGSFYYGKWGYENTNKYTDVIWAGRDTLQYHRTNTNASPHPTYSATIEHNWEIDSIGSELRSSVEFSGHKNNGDYIYTQKSDYSNGTRKAPEYEQIQRRDGQSNTVLVKSDYTQKIHDNMKVEAGIYGSWNRRFSPSRTWNMENGDSLLQQYNDFGYQEYIAALYATYGARWGGFSMSLGLRGEYTFTQVTTRDDEKKDYQVTDTGYFKLYPTVFLGYDFGKGHELQANYTRRINRPRGRQLNSFRDMSDSTNITFGNPYLEPEISSAVELNYIKSWEEHVLSIGAYYRYSDNCIERVRFLDNDNVMNSTFENIAKRQSAGLEIVSKNKFANWVNMTTTLNGYYSNMAEVYYDIYGTGNPIKLYDNTNSFSWSIRVMLNFLIPYGMTAQLTGHYRSSNLVAQGKSSDQYAIDFGFRKSFLDHKLNLALSVRDILNSRKWASTTWGDNFWQYSEHMPHGTQFKLTLTYNFGNGGEGKMKRRQGSQEGGGMDDGEGMGDYD